MWGALETDASPVKQFFLKSNNVSADLIFLRHFSLNELSFHTMEWQISDSMKHDKALFNITYEA